MPRYYKRKRSRRSKRFSRAVAKIATNAVFGKINNHRNYIEEQRGETINVPAQKIKYICVNHIGSRAQFENIINNTTGQDGAATGSASDKHRTFKITNYSTYFRFRNLSPHDCYVTAWEVTPKFHHYLTASQALTCEHLLQQLHAGWKHDLDDTADAYISAVANQDTESYLTMDSSYLFPSHSKQFNYYYKILRKKTFKLRGGGTAHFSQRCKNFVFDPAYWKGLTDADQGGGVEESTATTASSIKNITKFVLLRLHGDIGLDTGNQTLSGFMEIDIGAMRTTRARVMEIAQKDRATGLRVTVDAGITDLEAPDDQIMVADD